MRWRYAARSTTALRPRPAQATGLPASKSPSCPVSSTVWRLDGVIVITCLHQARMTRHSTSAGEGGTVGLVWKLTHTPHSSLLPWEAVGIISREAVQGGCHPLIVFSLNQSM